MSQRRPGNQDKQAREYANREEDVFAAPPGRRRPNYHCYGFTETSCLTTEQPSYDFATSLASSREDMRTVLIVSFMISPGYRRSTHVFSCKISALICGLLFNSDAEHICLEQSLRRCCNVCGLSLIAELACECPCCSNSSRMYPSHPAK